jgi:hypothetical protein
VDAPCSVEAGRPGVVRIGRKIRLMVMVEGSGYRAKMDGRLELLVLCAKSKHSMW